MPSDLADERPADLQRFLVLAAGGEDLLSLRRRLDHGALDPLPFHADSLDPEIVLGLDPEVEGLGIEHDLLAGQVLAGQRRRLVVAAVDRQQEGRTPLQAEGVTPAELHGSHPVDLRRRAGHAGTLRLSRLTVDLGRRKVAAGAGDEARGGPLDQRDGPASHVLPLHFLATQVIGEGDVGEDRGQLGTQGRIDLNSLDRVADADLEPAGIDLSRQIELVAPVPQRRGDGMLLAQPGHALARLPDAPLAEPGRNGERLAVRDHELGGQGLQGRERVARRVFPGCDQPPPGIRGRIGAEGQKAKRSGQGNADEPAPEAVPGGGHCARKSRRRASSAT